MKPANLFAGLAAACLALSACTSDGDEQEVGVTTAALTVADCPAGYNIIEGTSTGNIIQGTAGNDCILGYGGNDQIHGNGGTDFLIGGAGGDRLYGGDGNDTLHGEGGNDTLEGQGNNDSLFGSAGIDIIRGGDGDDRLFGDAGDDDLFGGIGNDILSGGSENDECFGEDGNDVVTGGAGDDALAGDGGDDFIADSSGTNTINGGAGSDSCTGTSCELAAPTASGCTITNQCTTGQTCVVDAGMCAACGAVGGSGCVASDDCPSDPNKIAPGTCGCGVPDVDTDADGTPDCNDSCASDPNKTAPGTCGCGTLDADSDGDGPIDCNDGCPNDPAKLLPGVCACGVADVDANADGITDCIGSAGTTLTVAACPGGYNIIQGNSAGNIIQGTAGNDCILGFGGNDTIYGNGGNDFLLGGPGNDKLYGGDGNDVLRGESGADILEGQNNDDTIYGGAGIDTMLGGSGLDWLHGGDADDVMDGNAGNDTLYGGAGIDTMNGSDGNDRLFGDEGTDDLIGGLGNDILDGGADSDECLGGEGADVVTGGAGDDVLVGDAGNDFIADNSGTNSVDGGAGSDSCAGASCELTSPVVSDCTATAQCAQAQTCVADVGMCLPCGTVGGSGCQNTDGCPSDPSKTGPGICGCGIPDDDSDADGVADCADLCYNSPDSQDADGDTIPDGCDVPFECTGSSSGPGVLTGDLELSGTVSPIDVLYLHGVQCITGSVVIESTDLVDLTFLETLRGIAGELIIDSNAQLTSVDGLDDVERIGGGIAILDNAALTSLGGLLRLDSVATEPIFYGLTIDGNAELPPCWVAELENLTVLGCSTPDGIGGASACDGNAGTGVCPSEVACAPGATGPGIYNGSIAITGATAEASLASLAGIRCVTGSISIAGTALTDIEPLTSLRAIGGALLIYNNSQLAGVAGLDTLESIGTSLDIESNAALESLAGLSSLVSLGAADPSGSVFVIGDNPQLPDCWRLALEAQVGVACTFPEYCIDNNGAGTCGGSTFEPVLLNENDKSTNVSLSADGLELRIANTQSNGGVRSTASVASGSGVWYFEMTQIGITGGGYFAAGVGPATASLEDSLGTTPDTIGLGGNGIVFYDGSFIGNFGNAETVGFVVDYRGANPIVHLIGLDWGVTAVRHKRTLPITAPLFAMFVGQAAHHGEIARFNFGSDTENHPFVHDAAAALTAAGDGSVASALVLGWGQTRALPHSEPAVLTVDSDLSVAVNTPVTLHASATDAEDGTLTGQILWENMAESYYVRQRGFGGSFTFTPTEIGKYPIHVLVKDSADIVTEDTIMVTVTGTLPQFDPVRLVTNSDTGAGISLSPDGLSAHYTENEKMGVRANQGNYGRFWYFEAHRISDASYSLGTGLTVSKGSLNPLSFFTTQPSLEVNFLGSAWRDLVFQANVPSTSGYYGFAVDYRADNPTIHVIVDDTVIYSITLDHVWVPLYPMLYGNSAPGPYDNVINFGETPFEFDPAAALTAASISTTGFEPYWGDANAP